MIPVPNVATVELESEVVSLRAGLEHLGAEVEAVRNVVEELVKERESGKEWEREEEERRGSMMDESVNGRQEQRNRSGTTNVAGPALRNSLPREDNEKTPKVGKGWKAAAGPETPRSGRSFLGVRSLHPPSFRS